MAMKKKLKSPSLLKAYHNPEFLDSPAARNIRILAEMMEPAYRLRLHNIRNTVVFFGSARTLPRNVARKEFKNIDARIKRTKSPSKDLIKLHAKAKANLEMARYYEDAVELSEKLTYWFKHSSNASHNFVVATGGGPGIMEAANKGAKKAKGKSIGFNINLPMEQDPNPFQTKDISFDFHYFFIRKFWFFYLAKAIVVFPGGFGTFDELFELLTVIQTEKTKKKMSIVIYGKDFWDEVVNFKALEKFGMISPEDLKLFKVVDDVDSAFDYLKAHLNKHYLK